MRYFPTYNEYMAKIPHKFTPRDFEAKWQAFWEAHEVYKTPLISPNSPSSPKSYILDMFPYPSSAGLHVGHPEGYTATDIYARYQRMKGFLVLHPMGWDAFGLPAENYAIKVGVHPAKTTASSIATFKRQITALGFSYDWTKELNTSDPVYYRWTQYIFTLLYQKGLAYKKKAPANWCEKCQTVLANEQVVAGKCERCHNNVIQKEIEQWFFKITAFAEDLLRDLERLDWPESTKKGQKNWIGKSEGMTIRFELQDNKQNSADSSQKRPKFLEVFTTRPDTLLGVTFLVLAPEHDGVLSITQIDNKPQMLKYQDKARAKSELQRASLEKDKTGVFTGAYAIHPLTHQPIPIYVADYVIMGYGTGVVMGVPAHDPRDYAFAAKYGLDILPVCISKEAYNKLSQEKSGNKNSGKFENQREIISAKGQIQFPQAENNNKLENPVLIDQLSSIGFTLPYCGKGYSVNCGKYSGLNSDDCYNKISEDIKISQIGRSETKYKLRDWLISRQRYWGAPIPIIYCGKCGMNLVPESDLPVLLPDDVDFRPTGESPLQRSAKFHQVKCPKCGGKARRESDTMDTFVCSSWYFIAFAFWEQMKGLESGIKNLESGKNQKNPDSKFKIQDSENNPFSFFSKEISTWLPVDLYVGGAEHTVLHLLYSRFITKALFKAQIIGFNEPFLRLRHIGMILGLDGQKMSKSRGNVINPDEIVEKFGADTMRLYEMFMGPIADKKPWNTHGVEGCRRFLSRIWHLFTETDKQILDCEQAKIWELTQELTMAVEGDIQELKFNTAIAKMMTWLNAVTGEIPNKSQIQNPKTSQNSLTTLNSLKVFLKILAPFAPHSAEELNFILSDTDIKNYKSIHLEKWPVFSQKADSASLSNKIFLVEVNGRVIERITNYELRITNNKDETEKFCLNLPKIQAKLAGRTIKKTIFIPNKLINFVA